jgi:hypothetical protein
MLMKARDTDRAHIPWARVKGCSLWRSIDIDGLLQQLVEPLTIKGKL